MRRKTLLMLAILAAFIPSMEASLAEHNDHPYINTNLGSTAVDHPQLDCVNHGESKGGVCISADEVVEVPFMIHVVDEETANPWYRFCVDEDGDRGCGFAEPTLVVCGDIRVDAKPAGNVIMLFLGHLEGLPIELDLDPSCPNDTTRAFRGTVYHT